MMQVSVLFCAMNLSIVFSAFYMLFLETTSFCTSPIEQIIPCHVTEFKMLLFFGLLHHDYWSLISPSFRNSSKYLATKCWREVSRCKTRHSYKKDYGKHLKRLERVFRCTCVRNLHQDARVS